MRTQQGLLFIVSSPSGAGKTTLCRELRKRHPGLRFSVSYTTRAQRIGEVPGLDYHFVTDATFQSMIDRGAFAEWATIHGNRYGTSVQTVQDALNQCQHVLFDIDYQGAESLQAQFRNEARLIYILPPSLAVLAARLRARGTESEDRVQARLKKAKEELSHHGSYAYLVLNDNMDHALLELSLLYQMESQSDFTITWTKEAESIVARCRPLHRVGLVHALLDEPLTISSQP